jgi:hypothetical protein
MRQFIHPCSSDSKPCCGLGVDEDGEMDAAKFGVDDRVRLIGTDTIQTIRQYNAETLEYQNVSLAVGFLGVNDGDIRAE